MKINKRHAYAIVSCCLVAALIPTLLFFMQRASSTPVNTHQTPSMNIAVFTSNASEEYNDKFTMALELDQSFNITYFTHDNITSFSITNPSSLNQEFDVVYVLDLLIGSPVTTEQLENITYAVQNGTMGLYFQPNNALQQYNTTLLDILQPVLPLEPVLDGSGFPAEIKQNLTDSISTILLSNQDVLTQKVGFISLPQLVNLTECIVAHPDAKLLVNASLGLTIGSKQYPMLATLDDDSTRVVQSAAPIRKDSNENLANWPYFTYYVYVTTLKLGGSGDIVDFADWKYAPIPQEGNQVFIILLLCGFAAFTLLLFMHFRRQTRKKPLELMPQEEFLRKVKEREEKKLAKKKKKTIKPTDGHDGELLEDGKQNDKIASIEEKTWRVPGYHKPLSGFFTMFFITLVVVAPLFVVVIYVLPTFIIQDPSSFGIQFIISSIFSAIFITLDFGLAQAYDRFVGQYWSTDPKKALQYVQFFIWYQMISGLIQTTVISLIGLYLVPRVASIGFMSWFFVVNTLVQFPGIVYVFTHLLKSAQRTDLEAVVNFISLIFFQIGLMAVFPEIFRSIGAANPIIGEVIGSSLGLSLGSYSAQMAQMFMSALFLKKIDKRFTVKQMFRLDFDKRLIKETLIFGSKSMLSNVVFLFGNFFSVLIITLFLNNYTYFGSFIGIATYLTYPILFMTTLYENALPTTSEAFNNKKVKLTEAFISYGFKYFGMFALLLFTLFVLPFSVNQIVTSVVPDLYKPMGYVIMYYSVTKIFIALGDFSKLFLISIDRAGTYVVAVIIEQIIRITFLLLTIRTLQFWAFVFGEIPGVIVKVFITWILTHKKIIKVRINWWQTLIAPGLACGIIALLAWILNALFFDLFLTVMTPVGGATIFMVIFFFGFSNFLYPFLLGVLGGHDDETLEQIEFAAYHCGPSKPFAIAFVKITKLGCKLSPLHGKNPIDFEAGRKEALELMEIANKGESSS